MAAPTASSAMRIAAVRRSARLALSPDAAKVNCSQLFPFPPPRSFSSCPSCSHATPRLTQLSPAIPPSANRAPLSPIIRKIRRYSTANQSADAGKHEEQQQKETGSQTHTTETEDTSGNRKANHDGPRRSKSPARLTLYAGVSVFSALLLALSQPLSYMHVGHHGQQDAKHGGSDDNSSADINTDDAPPPPPPPSTSGDQRDPSLPRFRLADVRKHDAKSGSPWVTSGDKVYDITDWVAAHPGGDVILRAAGRSIDPYWAIFTIHKAPHVREILDTYLIGLVDLADLDTSGQPKILAGEDALEDPFATDPVRDKRLFVHTQKPCNAEPAAPHLARDFATPNELFYVRNHMWVPVVDAADAGQHRLTVELPDGEVREYTVDELRARFRHHRVTAVLQCSGNRRSDMTKAAGKTNGLQWAAGAISNAVWEGVLLRDVLADAGLQTTDWQPRRAIGGLVGGCNSSKSESDSNSSADDLPETDSLHVQLAGMEAYAASIPLPVALDPRGDVLLAFSMNGAPLPRDHGYPLRAVVPGFVAARSVKWLSRIVVADEESPSQWQRRDYKLFGPNEGAAPNWDRYPAIQEMPITSAITGVWVGSRAIQQAVERGHLVEGGVQKSLLGSRAAPGVRDVAAWQADWTKSLQQGKPFTPVAVMGYAYSGGGREIVRVDVSVDGGRTWDQAELLDHQAKPYDEDAGEDASRKNIVARGRRDFAWKRWRYEGCIFGEGEGGKEDGRSSAATKSEIVVKAIDSSYNTQPEHHDGIYNVRGNLATAWHRVTVDTSEKTAKVQGCGFVECEEGKK